MKRRHLNLNFFELLLSLRFHMGLGAPRTWVTFLFAYHLVFVTAEEKYKKKAAEDKLPDFMQRKFFSILILRI